MPTIIETLFDRTATLNAEHQAKIEDVKDSLWNKDWIVQRYFQKGIVVAGFFSLLFVIYKFVRLLW